MSFNLLREIRREMHDRGCNELSAVLQVLRLAYIRNDEELIKSAMEYRDKLWVYN